MLIECVQAAGSECVPFACRKVGQLCLPRNVKLDDLTPDQRAVVLGAVAAKKSAEERKPEPITDPVALRKLAGLIAPALRRLEDR